MRTALRAGALAALALTIQTLPTAASAGPADYVSSPIVEEGEREIDLKLGSAKFRDGTRETQQSLGLGLGVNSWWFTELYAIWHKEPGEPYSFDAWEWENKFQLTETGRYPVDLGFLFEIERPRDHGEIKLRIRIPGYGDQTVIADAAGNLSTTVYLNKLGTAAIAREGAERTVAKSPPVPAGTIEWKIASRPSGATVIRAETGETLGVTPLSLTQPAGSGTTKVLLRAAGYADQPVILDQASPMDMKYVLKSLKQRPKRPSAEEEIPLFDSDEGSGGASPAAPDSRNPAK